MKNTMKLLTIFIFASVLDADQLSFQFNNDVFAGTDRHYSNGVALSWMDDTYDNKYNSELSIYSNVILGGFDYLVGLDESKKYNAGISLSQAILTPDDISQKTAQYDDAPYAAYLALSFYLFERDDDSFNEYRLVIGVVGDEAGGKLIQNGFHIFIDNKDAKGWNTQLKTHYSATLLLQHGEVTWEHYKTDSLSMDWFNHIGVQAGNFTTDLFAGTMFRIGDNYTRSFNIHSPLLSEEAAMINLNNRNDKFGWSLNAGLSVALSAYSYIIEESRDEGYSMDKKTVSGSLYLGTELFYKRHKLAFFYESPTKYLEQQNSRDVFGGFTYAYSF